MTAHTLPRGPVNLTEKHRPHNLADVRGQDQAIVPLLRFLENPCRMAFLFEGETGTGKTSAAVALARELGVEVDQPQVGGFYEIPSGEQTGESVRELARSLALVPMMGSGWKVAVINEADYMSPSAAQIWLDVLENLPPKSVVIFTTNHAHKLPRRFLDRCTRHYFEASALILKPSLEAFVADLWKTYGGRGKAPTLEELDVVDEQGNASFRRALRAIEPHLQAGTRPAAKAKPQVPQLRAIAGGRKESLDWDGIASAFRAGKTFLEIARQVNASWQLVMCGLKKRGVC